MQTSLKYRKEISNCLETELGSGWSWFQGGTSELSGGAVDRVFLQIFGSRRSRCDHEGCQCFCRCEGIRERAHQVFTWKDLTLWRPILPFPRHPSAFLMSTLNSFQGCPRSATAAANDLILAEVGGRCPRQETACPWRRHARQRTDGWKLSDSKCSLPESGSHQTFVRVLVCAEILTCVSWGAGLDLRAYRFSVWFS